MEIWEFLQEEIEHRRVQELERLEFGAFRNDLNGYNRTVGFLEAFRFIEAAVQNMNKGDNNATDEDGTQF